MSDQVCIVTLEACPFCGGEASADGVKRYCDATVAEQNWRQSEFYYCNCMRCGASNCGLVGHRTRDDAIAAWNRRALAPSIPAEIGELVERLNAEVDEQRKMGEPIDGPLVADAAAALLSLSARVGELERALLDFMPPYEPWMDEHADDVLMAHYKPATFGALRRARSALTHPAPTHEDGSGEADPKPVRDMAGETRYGFRVAAYRETDPEYGPRYSAHWSTPNWDNPDIKVERLYTEDQLVSALSHTSGEVTEATPRAYLVHDFHVQRAPVKARGRFPEATEYLYPASRAEDAKETAKLMRGTCTPLFAKGDSE